MKEGKDVTWESAWTFQALIWYGLKWCEVVMNIVQMSYCSFIAKLIFVSWSINRVVKPCKLLKLSSAGIFTAIFFFWWNYFNLNACEAGIENNISSFMPLWALFDNKLHGSIFEKNYCRKKSSIFSWLRGSLCAPNAPQCRQSHIWGWTSLTERTGALFGRWYHGDGHKTSTGRGGGRKISLMVGFTRFAIGWNKLV